MADNKVQMPVSGGGLLRFGEEVKSRFMISPMSVVIVIAIVTVALIVLYKFGQ